VIYNFKSKGEYFEKEKKGIKPNTVRLVGKKDMRRKIKAGDIIRIRNSEDENDYFEREVTDKSIGGEILGKLILIISWKIEGITDKEKFRMKVLYEGDVKCPCNPNQNCLCEEYKISGICKCGIFNRVCAVK